VPTQGFSSVVPDADLYTMKWYVGVPCLLTAGTAATLVVRQSWESMNSQTLIVVLLYPSIVYMSAAMALAVGVGVWVVTFLAWFALSIDDLSLSYMLLLLFAGVLSVSKVSGDSHHSIGCTTRTLCGAAAARHPGVSFANTHGPTLAEGGARLRPTLARGAGAVRRAVAVARARADGAAPGDRAGVRAVSEVHAARGGAASVVAGGAGRARRGYGPRVFGRHHTLRGDPHAAHHVTQTDHHVRVSVCLGLGQPRQPRQPLSSQRFPFRA
jgi:hypothetical protein